MKRGFEAMVTDDESLLNEEANKCLEGLKLEEGDGAVRKCRFLMHFVVIFRLHMLVA